MSELTTKPAVELLAMLQRRSISCLELAQEHIREIERLEPYLHAFADFDGDRVLRTARDADCETDIRRRSLWGLPMTVKASISTAGHRCETGSVLHRGFIPEEDAAAVKRLREAGAVLLGTTNCPEFLMAYETNNLLYGPTANPWSLQRSAGGSSGGESAAIAAGLSAGGLGSDSGGSVRVPAHFTGICSLKPTPGRIAARGHLPPCFGPFSTLGALGPMARTARDVSLLFQVLSSRDNTGPAGIVGAQRHPTLEQLRSKPVAVLEDDGLVPVTAETRQAVRAAAKALEERGFQTRSFRSPGLEQARELWWKFFMRCGRMLLEPMIEGREEELSSTFRYFLDVTRKEPLLSGKELLDAWILSDQVKQQLLDELSEYSVLITPVSSIPAFRHGEREWLVEGKRVEYFNAMRFTQWFNLLAAPAAVVPVGRSEQGLPIGVQIASLPYHDEVVLRVAELLDEDFGYCVPPMALASDMYA